MAHNSALTALALAGVLIAPGPALGREFMDGAAGHCLLCDFLREAQRREADANCRQPSAKDLGGSEPSNETSDVN